jgi:hypothetical protein
VIAVRGVGGPGWLWRFFLVARVQRELQRDRFWVSWTPTSGLRGYIKPIFLPDSILFLGMAVSFTFGKLWLLASLTAAVTIWETFQVGS